ncbi:MAG: hypothetical protein ACOX9R_08350 [Armatimonadota bacterium]|jgi:hypothetical protein
MMQTTRNADWTINLDEHIVIAVPTDGGEGVAYLMGDPLRVEIPKEHVELTETDEAYVLRVI